MNFIIPLQCKTCNFIKKQSYQASLEKETKPFSNGRLLLFHFFPKPLKILPKKTLFFGYFSSYFVTCYKSTRIILKICIFID